MDLKAWYDYSNIEKKKLLKLWFRSCRTINYTIDELREFRKMVNEDADKVMNAATNSVCCSLIEDEPVSTSADLIIGSISLNQVEEMYDSMPKLEELADNKDAMDFYNGAQEVLLQHVVQIYNLEKIRETDQVNFGKLSMN